MNQNPTQLLPTRQHQLILHLHHQPIGVSDFDFDFEF